MLFSNDSDVTIVITSCGRFDLLKRTLESLDKFNTYPIKQVLITEDSGDSAVHDVVPLSWRAHTRVFVNEPKLGQMASVDLAYAHVETEWVFHCEDDWEFYRPGFIDDSKKLLLNDKQALQVWLRSYAHDLCVHSPYIYLGPRAVYNEVAYYQLMSRKQDWQGFSFNPGLRRLKDYQQHAPYLQHGGEKNLSRLYHAENRYALILENDAVLHTGFGEHVVDDVERKNKKRRKKREKIKNVSFFLFGLLAGLGATFL